MIERHIFNQFKELILAKTGISLKEGKESLLEGRIGKRLRELGLSSPNEYYDFLTSDRSGDELIKFIDAISTNVTHFFREAQHFQILEQVLNLWASRGQKKFRIWSAASSTGQEPYSIAMTVANVFGCSGHDVKILATDICTHVLATASEGIYDKRELSAIPEHFRAAHTQLLPDRNSFTINAGVKDLLTYARLNLSVQPYPMSGPFDCIFCRNVMIYFDQDLKNKIALEAYRLLRPGGILFIGHSETLASCSIPLRLVMPSVYRKEV